MICAENDDIHILYLRGFSSCFRRLIKQFLPKKKEEEDCQWVIFFTFSSWFLRHWRHYITHFASECNLQRIVPQGRRHRQFDSQMCIDCVLLGYGPSSHAILPSWPPPTKSNLASLIRPPGSSNLKRSLNSKQTTILILNYLYLWLHYLNFSKTVVHFISDL